LENRLSKAKEQKRIGLSNLPKYCINYGEEREMEEEAGARAL
jgi:putative hemolysin